MKILLAFLTILFSNFIQPNFDFYATSQKDSRWGMYVGALKPEFMQQIKRIFNPDIFLETGTYNGDTSILASSIFAEVHTIELFRPLYDQAKKNLSPYHNIFPYFGSSHDVFRALLPTAKGSVVFWLDAHYSGPGTALNVDDKTNPEAFTPITKELNAIHESGVTDCIILIDDIRGFGSKLNDEPFMNWLGYPTIQDICNSLYRINKNFEISLIGDILLAYDKTKFNVSLSPVADACTKSRLYDGKNLRDQELISIEQTIAHATGEERKFIEYLNNITFEEKSKGLFIYTLWEGLISYQNGDYNKAYNSFKSILAPKTHFNERFESTDSPVLYNHWRIHWYLEQAALKLNKLDEALRAREFVNASAPADFK